MAILGTEVTSTLSKGGETQNNLDALRDSKLHNQYSLNGNPHIDGKPTPSVLDDYPLIRYVDNKPT